MRARVVDWSLLALVIFGIGTGLWSFLVGDARGQWLFVAHGAFGLAILGVLAAKLRRVTPLVLSERSRQESMLAGILTAAFALLTVGIGLWWVIAQTPVTYPNGMILHTSAAFVLLGLCLWHLFVRYRPLKARDVHDRRSIVRLLAILVGGGALWAGVEGVQRVTGTAGSRRRFTGSRQETGALPVTMWMFDRIALVESETYYLEVSGAIQKPLRFGLSELARLPQTSLMATLDCTGGWYSEREWQGIRVAQLLALAEPTAKARYVRFRSVTGYRWSLPLNEAATTLLATHMDGSALDAGHGAPLRLVAPRRRGFQWVKWVVAVEVLEEPDLGQWAAIFASGLDGA